jgi:hypothetical protein
MLILKHFREGFSQLTGAALLFLLSQTVLGQQEERGEAEAAPAPADAAEELRVSDDPALKPAVTLEQITVTAQRTLYRLRAQIEDARNSLYSSYNDLNQKDEFDVNCRQSDWTGTHIREQVCWPVFFERAVAENSQDFLRGNAVLEPTRQLQTQYQGKFDELRANLIQVAAENPAVEEALVELGTLEAAYERKRAECMEQTPVLLIFRVCR